MIGNQNIKTAKDMLLEVFGTELSAPIDVQKIVDHYKIELRHDETLEKRDIVGEICSDNGKAIIKINPVQNSYEPRMRFTIAHELGHYVLHMNGGGCFIDDRVSMERRNSYVNHYESQANQFAAELLMPISLVVKYGTAVIEESNKTQTEKISAEDFIEKMADIFSVSIKTMEYRLINLGIIKD